MKNILIQFDENFEPTFSVLADTDEDEKTLKAFVDKIMAVIKGRKDE